MEEVVPLCVVHRCFLNFLIVQPHQGNIPTKDWMSFVILKLQKGQLKNGYNLLRHFIYRDFPAKNIENLTFLFTNMGIKMWL